MLNLLRKKQALYLLRWILFASTLVFVCGQSLAASHTHLDNHPYQNCTLCLYGHNSQMSVDPELFTVLVASYADVVCTKTNSWIQLTPPSSYLTRAPPQA